MAFGAIVLMTTFLLDAGIHVEPLQVGQWGFATAICAFAIHAWRLYRLASVLARELKAEGIEPLSANASATKSA